MRFDCVERRFSRLFSSYILAVKNNSIPFLVLPVILTLILSVGLKKHQEAFVKDELELYTPIDARARIELQNLNRLFYINDSDSFYAIRRYEVKRSGYIIVTNANEEEDVLNPAVLSAAMHLWSVIQAMTVETDQVKLTYPSICVKFPIPLEFGDVLGVVLAQNNNQKICVSNPIVEMFKFMFQNKSTVFNKSLDEITLGQIAEAVSIDSFKISHLMGGITVDKNKRISGAKALLLPYALKHSTKDEDDLAEKWELKLVDYLLSFKSPLIETSWWTYETLASESARDREQLIKMLGPCFTVVSLYTVVCCCVRSWVRSRPWLAIGGVINAAMAIISAVGLLLLADFKITSIAYSMPFIVFSVGVDNVFILLSAWRITNPKKTLNDRLAEAFGNAAVSITVTSLTDLISFTVGCFTPFPSVQMFCVYAVVAVMFTYIYQLTFFAAILVYTCAREEDQRHCVTFRATAKTPFDLQKDVPFNPKYPPMRYEPSNKSVKEKKVPFSLATFFRTTYSDFILHPYTKTIIFFGFVFYLMAAVYGCLHLKMGLEPNDLLPDNSYGKRAIKITEKYFSEYGSYLHVWMFNLSKVKLGRKTIWKSLLDEIRLYEHTEYTEESDSWVKVFLDFISKNDLGLNTTSFVPILKNNFLKQPQYFKYKRDVRFIDNGTVLEASRMPVQLRFVGSANQSKAMHLFRHLATTSELPTDVYADFFQFAEQYNAVLPGTLSSIAMAALAVVLVSLVLIPEPIAALWVTLSIMSINLGILGFMNFCSVRLDFISMVTIVMSIGFCVDFAAHLAYHFAKEPDLCENERVREALYSVGVPILQSASSTMIGVSFMSSTESYVFRSFLKTIILVITLGVLHGLVILPVFLTVFSCKKRRKPQKPVDFPVSTLKPRSDNFSAHNLDSFNTYHSHNVSSISTPMSNFDQRYTVCPPYSQSTTSSHQSRMSKMRQSRFQDLGPY